MTEQVPDEVGVIGGGRMGAGIAHAFLGAGARVTIVEQSARAADVASERLRRIIDESARRAAGGAAPRFGSALDPAAGANGSSDVFERVSVVVGVDALATCSLVIEAVPEIAEVKLETLRLVEGVVGREATIATNTSSIAVAELAEALEQRDRFLGMHFFNPVPVSQLVEIVSGEATAAAVSAEAAGWVRALGKVPILVRDSPGFASSRLGVMLGLEAIRMLEDGVASAADIDAAMTLGYRHPVGPLRLTDLVGLDVRLDIAEYLAERLGPRFEPPALLRRLVAEGRLGRKSGAGFYDWSEENA
ncbi:3-hydroxyacyl-CoA dehydrogenase family protein [Agromyces atrinae]|uniref:3-hydroxyacyl-CoA dehydrogenase family protein n=1 Tax=Agromyces atrinae TaxID=592376 RepID=UPI001F5622A6|nr:3-hydroxyacyl-CoA dehydrogenase family protein [Agromyces atrinae]MCI2956316.1 3-hydroxyacyl-CoA dehydrogenase family protein [Agromyces atrinae]